jgi:hypothetical protein
MDPLPFEIYFSMAVFLYAFSLPGTLVTLDNETAPLWIPMPPPPSHRPSQAVMILHYAHHAYNLAA